MHSSYPHSGYMQFPSLVLDLIILVANSSCYEAPHYAVFSNSFHFIPLLIQIFSSAPCSQAPFLMYRYHYLAMSHLPVPTRCSLVTEMDNTHKEKLDTGAIQNSNTCAFYVAKNKYYVDLNFCRCWV
jgi:hypothetical protein